MLDMTERAGLVNAGSHGNLDLGVGFPSNRLATSSHARADCWSANRVGITRSG